MSIITMQSQVKKNQLLETKSTQLLFFLENGWRPFCILSFSIYYKFFVNIAIILIDVHYFDAKSSEKAIVTGKMHKITYS